MITRGMVLDKDSEKLIIQATDDQIEQFAIGDRVKVRAVVHPTVAPSMRYFYAGAGGTMFTTGATDAWPPMSIGEAMAALEGDRFIYDANRRRIARVASVSIETNFYGTGKIRIEAEWP